MRSQLRSLIPPLILCYFASLVAPFLFPSIRPLGYVGALVLSMSRLPLSYTLWVNAGIGLFIDIASNSTPFGFFAVNYALSTLIVFRYKKLFSEEKIFIFPLYATFFSFVSTFVHYILYGLVDLQLKIQVSSILTDLFLMPIFDGVYAFLFVFGPISLERHLFSKKQLLLYRRLYRKGMKRCLLKWDEYKELFWKKKMIKKNPF